MGKNQALELVEHTAAGGNVTALADGVQRLEIPAGKQGVYRLAQLDDYAGLPRRSFRWHAPLEMSLRARASAAGLPGTWGFGLWNDPFSLTFGFGGGARRLPALPNAAWFFHGSKANHLSFRDDLPGNGFLAGTFRSPVVPSLLLGIGVPLLPLLAWRAGAGIIRRVLGKFIQQGSEQIDVDVTQWHEYNLKLVDGMATFRVGGESVLETTVVPQGKLGLVVWVDNQYAALAPDEKLGFGTEENPTQAWLEIASLAIRHS